MRQRTFDKILATFSLPKKHSKAMLWSLVWVVGVHLFTLGPLFIYMAFAVKMSLSVWVAVYWFLIIKIAGFVTAPLLWMVLVYFRSQLNESREKFNVFTKINTWDYWIHKGYVIEAESLRRSQELIDNMQAKEILSDRTACDKYFNDYCYDNLDGLFKIIRNSTGHAHKWVVKKKSDEVAIKLKFL